MGDLRDQIIQTLLATHGQSDGVTADALLAIMSTTGGEAVADDVVADALDNLVHDNYELSWKGGKAREADAGIVRAAIYRARPAPTVDDGVLRDAERYRWLRSEIENGAVQGVSGALVELYDETMYDDGDELDAAIDAAMAKEQGDAKSDR